MYAHKLYMIQLTINIKRLGSGCWLEKSLILVFILEQAQPFHLSMWPNLDIVKPPDYSYKWFIFKQAYAFYMDFWKFCINSFLYFWFTDSLAIVRRHGCRHVERGYMSKNKALLCLQRKNPFKRKIFVIFSSLKSEASPTQTDLNYRSKAWHCKL